MYDCRKHIKTTRGVMLCYYFDRNCNIYTHMEKNVLQRFKCITLELINLPYTYNYFVILKYLY